MKRNKYKDYLWYTALAVFIICVIEAYFSITMWKILSLKLRLIFRMR